MLAIVKDVIDIDTNKTTERVSKKIIGKKCKVWTLEVGKSACFDTNIGNLHTLTVSRIEDFKNIKQVTTLNTIYLLDVLEGE